MTEYIFFQGEGTEQFNGSELFVNIDANQAPPSFSKLLKINFVKTATDFNLE